MKGDLLGVSAITEQSTVQNTAITEQSTEQNSTITEQSSPKL